MDKRYLTLGEAASRLNLEVLDLVSYGIEGEVPIGVLAYSGINLAPLSDAFFVADGDDNQTQNVTPDWIIMLMPRSIRAIAQQGRVLSGHGYRWLGGEWEPVDVSRESGITLDDLVIPTSALREFVPDTKQHIVQPELPVSTEGKETFQKQIAGLAMVIHRHTMGKKFGGASPNNLQIAKAVLSTMDELPPEIHKTLNTKGIGDGVIRQNISKGLQLLGFAAKEDGEL